jgi:hypothetical protein
MNRFLVIIIGLFITVSSIWAVGGGDKNILPFKSPTQAESTGEVSIPMGSTGASDEEFLPATGFPRHESWVRNCLTRAFAFAFGLVGYQMNKNKVD